MTDTHKTAPECTCEIGDICRSKSCCYYGETVPANVRTAGLPTSMNAELTGEVRGFMCLIDWQYEIGAAADGNKIYPSADALRRGHSCADDCGIVEVEVRIRRVVSEGTGE